MAMLNATVASTFDILDAKYVHAVDNLYQAYTIGRIAARTASSW
jgi:hypothetical protein